MDVNILIAKVFERPPVWDKRTKEYSNRNIVDACWKAIGKEMGLDQAVLRKKWKYLRDQFAVEVSKIKPPRSGDAGDSAYVPKWPYFKSLLFLKDIVRPRQSSSNLRRPEPTVNEDVDSPEVQESESALEETSNNSNREATEVDEPIDMGEVMNTTTSQNQGQPLKRKRVPTNSKYNDQILRLEHQKVQVLQSVMQREPDSDDLMFFKSLLPYMKNIPSHQKLRFRSRIQDLVEEFSDYTSRPPPSYSDVVTSPPASAYHSGPTPPQTTFHAMSPSQSSTNMSFHSEDLTNLEGYRELAGFNY